MNVPTSAYSGRRNRAGRRASPFTRTLSITVYVHVEGVVGVPNEHDRSNRPSAGNSLSAQTYPIPYMVSRILTRNPLDNPMILISMRGPLTSYDISTPDRPCTHMKCVGSAAFSGLLCGWPASSKQLSRGEEKPVVSISGNSQSGAPPVLSRHTRTAPLRSHANQRFNFARGGFRP